MAVIIGMCGCAPDAAPAQRAGLAAAADPQPGPAAPRQDTAGDSIPAQLLDLSCWKLTLPVDSGRSGTPDEIRQPELAEFVQRPYFHADLARGVVLLRAPCGGVPTRGSRYPRCELRQMNDGGRTPAAWDTGGAAVQVLMMRAAVTATPAVRKHLVVAQVHDARDDVLMIRLEAPVFLIEQQGHPDVVLEPEYQLGDPFELRIVAGQGRIGVWWNGKQKLDRPVLRVGCYFKAGCYTQSNPERGDAAESYAEVAIHELRLQTGEPSPPGSSPGGRFRGGRRGRADARREPVPS